MERRNQEIFEIMDGHRRKSYDARCSLWERPNCLQTPPVVSFLILTPGKNDTILLDCTEPSTKMKQLVPDDLKK